MVVPLISDIEQAKRVPTRNGFGAGLAKAGASNPQVVVLCADLTESTRAKDFKDKFPERFIEIGVAEQNLAAVASGLAAVGKIPFVTSYAMFSPGRSWERIRTTIAYNDRPVKIAGAHAGISVGPDGATHQALEDIGIMRGIPNMIVIAPCDAMEMEKATMAAAGVAKPVYLRFGREKTPVITTQDTPFVIGKAEVFREGEDVAIIACGIMVYESLKAAQELERTGIQAAVINCHTIKPLDAETILSYAKKCKSIVTAEEHQVHNGLGSAVAEAVSEQFPVPVVRVGVSDRFGESGTPDELLDKFGLRAKDIIAAAIKAMSLGNPEKLFGPVDTQMAQSLLGKTSPQTAFHLSSGVSTPSIKHLADEIQMMDDAVFSFHVTSEKNDFSNWICDVFGQERLSLIVRQVSNPQDLAILLDRFIHHVNRERSNTP